MAELNLKQIIDRLNAEFTGDTRKLVFWYDDKADFAEDLENVELENAKIYRLQPDNQFLSAVWKTYKFNIFLNCNNSRCFYRRRTFYRK